MIAVTPHSSSALRAPASHVLRWPVWFGAAALVALAGCLSVPDDPEPMCASSDDCDTLNGEVCDEGVCWGNPPPGPFAAVISPPSGRRDLVPREQLVTLPPDGWMGELTLEAPVLLTGKVVAFCPPLTTCDQTALAATVTVSRPTLFHGGPGFNTAVNVKSGESFSIPVPRSREGDAMYTVMVVPDGGSRQGTGPAEQVPPAHLEFAIAENIQRTITLGGLDLPKISGRLTNSLGQGVLGYRIAALGRWDTVAPPTEVSTVDFTDASGVYEVKLAAQLAGTVELVARPLEGAIAPAIHIANIDATRDSVRDISLPPTLGNPLQPTVRVTGLDRNGMVSPVRGALVKVTGTLTGAPAGTLTSFTVTDEQVTNMDGNVTLNLLDGPGIVGNYQLSITPPAGSSLGVVFNQRFIPWQTSTIRLSSRFALSGRILDSSLRPLPNVTVTARPSLRFLWTLESAPQAFVAAVPAATAVTPDTTSGVSAGSFLVWVDANVAQVWGHYDLLIEPLASAQAPAHLKADLVLPRDSTLDSLALGDIVLPDAAFVHGRITTERGAPVEKAEIRLYRVSTTLDLCSEVANEPRSCPIPAQLQGRNISDGEGTVRLALPR